MSCTQLQSLKRANKPLLVTYIKGVSVSCQWKLVSFDESSTVPALMPGLLGEA